MKSVIILAIALLPLCLAGTMDQHKRNMLKKNKTPKDSILIRGAPISAYEVDEDGTVKLNDACTECKELVKRLNDAIKDPTKMAELKNLLTIFCDTTSYASECKLIVSRLDFILKELQPYLDNPQQFCQKLHICGNARLSQFHRMALVYAKKYMNRVDGVADDLVCDECQFAAMELKKVVEDRSTQTEIQQFISDKICKHLGKLQGTCDEVVEQFLPEFFNELDQMLQNTKQFCTDLGLCQGETVEVEAQPMSPARRTGANSVDHNRLPRPQPLRLKSSWELLKKLQTKKGIKMTCLECEVAVDALIAELETDGALDPAADDIRSLVCDHIFPEEWQAGCDDFMRIYLKSALYMTVAVAKSRKICEMMHACTPQASRQIARLTKAEKESEMCEACKGVTSFLRNELRDATFKTDVEDELENYVCAQLPDSAKSVCQNIVETYTPMVLDKLATLVNDEAICKNELHMCTEAEDSEDV